MTIHSALIIGAGVAGPAAALALQKAGIKSTIYESHAVAADGVGVFLTLAPNGIRALRTLNAEIPALAGGFITPTITLRNAKGKFLGKTATGPAGEPSWTMKRADLYGALQDETVSRRITLEYGKQLIRADSDSDGVTAHFADGSSARADILIGADGIFSTVRNLIIQGAPAPRYSGLLTTGGYATATGLMPDTEPGCYEMIFGRHAFFGYAAAPTGEVWWFANLPQSQPEIPRQSKAELRGHLLQLFADDAGPAAELIEATHEIPPLTAIHTMPKLPTWHRDRMIVIGDAAHAPSPTSGQGASLSIEDAVLLAKLLRDEPTPAAAFAAFQSQRQPRVERIIKWAARMNNSKAAGPIGAAIRDSMMPTMMKLTANSKSAAENYNYAIDWTARPAAHQSATSR